MTRPTPASCDASRRRSSPSSKGPDACPPRRTATGNRSTAPRSRELVCEQFAEILGVDPDTVTLDARVREDLDADDFALIDLAEAVEAELGERSVGLTIDDDDLSS